MKTIYVPYDLSLPEDREILRKMWVKHVTMRGESPIVGLTDSQVEVKCWGWTTPEHLLRSFVNARTGTPCGKPMEVRDE